jgi:hypothetical protein
MSSLGPHVFDVDAARLPDSEAEQPEHGDQCRLVRGRRPRRSDERAELHAVQAQHL